MEHRRKNARANAAAAAGPAAGHGLPDELLASIFLRLPSLLHLVRASCACRLWRRVIADGSFLRDFRALRVPSLVAGHFRVSGRMYGPRPTGCDPVFVPSPSSPLTGGDADAPRRLSFDFLPHRSGDLPEWEIADRRGAIYLLLNEGTRATPYRLPNLVVCEPFSRRYTVVPPLADLHGCRCFGAFLLDDDDGSHHGLGAVTVSRFRVLYALYRYGVARACVFSSRSGSWANDARRTADCGVELLPGLRSIFFAGQSSGYAHWVTMAHDRVVLALDKDKPEFSSFSLPEGVFRWGSHSLQVLRQNRSSVSVVCLATDDLKVFTRKECGGWVLDARVLLSQATCTLPGYKEWYFKGPGKIVSEAEGRVLVVTPWEEEWLISVNLETSIYIYIACC
ncbi:hypothetical protein C2845_PM03G31890 [Panicum miliaceum]|uniref:F-box domain-containing protein n=1 Tax=Panicum miliaceum TaxID=4540 RepID=A0A3L6T700_PANMI|nr:hypothetical protein C2845_PM03G31890 [Panicum miliaceum]